MYLSQIAKSICLKLLNVFVSNCKKYLSQIAKDRVSREQDELAVRFKAVVHLVAQGRVVPGGREG